MSILDPLKNLKASLESGERRGAAEMELRLRQRTVNVGLPAEAYPHLLTLAETLSKHSAMNLREAFDLVLDGVADRWRAHLRDVRTGVTR